MKLLRSPLATALSDVFSSAERSLFIASPFVSSSGLRAVTRSIGHRAPHVEILTNLATDSLLHGTNDPTALAAFCREQPQTATWHLAGLHAKAYIADERCAVITSANLTAGGLVRNYEYAVLVDSAPEVRAIARDFAEYARLGIYLSLVDLQGIADIARNLKEKRERAENSADRTLVNQLEGALQESRERFLELRAAPGETTNEIFARTIVYLLQTKPMSTAEMHPIIQGIHPDLCDDSIDRVIRGVNFGRRWKHMVRNAQQALKRQGLIEYHEGKWQLAG